MVRDEKIARSPLSREMSGCSSIGDARHRGARLALAARAQHDGLVGRQVGEPLLIEIGEAFRQVAGVDRDLDDAMQRAPRDHERAPGGVRGIGNRLDARDVGGKRRHRHAARRAAL